MLSDLCVRLQPQYAYECQALYVDKPTVLIRTAAVTVDVSALGYVNR